MIGHTLLLQSTTNSSNKSGTALQLVHIYLRLIPVLTIDGKSNAMNFWGLLGSFGAWSHLNHKKVGLIGSWFSFETDFNLV